MCLCVSVPRAKQSGVNTVLTLNMCECRIVDCVHVFVTAYSILTSYHSMLPARRVSNDVFTNAVSVTTTFFDAPTITGKLEVCDSIQVD